MKKMILSLVLAVIFFFKITNVNATCSGTNTWDLVDSGNKIHWSGSTYYQTQWAYAVATWNYYMQSVSIEKDTIFTANDLTIDDYYAEDVIMAITQSNGKMWFNTFHFSYMNDLQRKKTMLHEIGNALRLDDRDSVWISVMIQGLREMDYLGPIDKDTYDCVWE